MRAPIIATLCILVAGVAGGTGWWLGQRHDPAPAAVPAAKAPGQREVLYWYEPVVPKQPFDRSGKSPVVDVRLMPRCARGAAGAGDEHAH